MPLVTYTYSLPTIMKYITLILLVFVLFSFGYKSNKKCCLCTCKNKDKYSQLDTLFSKGKGTRIYCLVSKSKKSKIIRFSRDGTHQTTDNFILITNGNAKYLKAKSDKEKLNKIVKFLKVNNFNKQKRKKCLKEIKRLIDCNNDPRSFGVF